MMDRSPFPPLEWHVRRLRPGARLPTRAHAEDGGWDLHYCAPEGAEQGEPALRTVGDLHIVEVPTGLAMAFSPGWFFKIEARSGWARDHGVHVLGGVVDAGYRGEVIVMLRVPVVLRDGGHRSACRIVHGTRIAQGLFLPVPLVEPRELAPGEELPPSRRGTAGWGSSGR